MVDREKAHPGYVNLSPTRDFTILWRVVIQLNYGGTKDFMRKLSVDSLMRYESSKPLMSYIEMKYYFRYVHFYT